MIENTIQAVKKAEAEADACLAEAKQKADQIRKDGEEAAEQDAARRMAEAKKAGEAALAKAGEEAEQEADALRTAAEGRKAEAIDAVVRTLFGTR